MLCVRWLMLAAAAAALCGGARAQRPAPACPRDQAHSCIAREHDLSTYRFDVNGTGVIYEFTDGDFFVLVCSTIAVDEPALPRFEPALRVREVRLDNCWPRNASFEAALRALNVTGLEAPDLGGVAAHPTFLIQLKITQVRNYNLKVLTAMTTLRNLSINYITHTDSGADLVLLPAGLENLDLWNTQITRVPATTLARLPHLRNMFVFSYKPIVLESAGNLSSLRVSSLATTLANLSLPDTLRGLYLKSWTSRNPMPWHSCTSLDSLDIYVTDAETLPDGWLARCKRLRVLRLEEANNLRTLSAGALRDAIALEEVVFMRCALEVLPAGLLDDARALRVFDLQGTSLHTLPGELFRSSVSLNKLHLTDNRLTGSVLEVLESITSVRELRLDGNPELDACPVAPRSEYSTTQEWSPLRNMENLAVLSLAGTATSRVCAGWRQLPRLQEIDLSDTAITQLNYTDLQFNTTVNITVALPTVAIYLRREDYNSVFAAPAGPTLTLRLSEPLRCDCELYWAAAAMRLPGTRLREEDVRCTNERALRDMSLEELVCTPPGAPGLCPEGCACGAREDVARSGPVLRVDCARARLRRVPSIHARDMLRYEGADPIELDLNLTDNRIDRLTPEDLPPELAVLDLRYNALTAIDAATATALVSRADRRVRLAGNPLECGCRAAAALATMLAHPAVFHDLANTTCSNGTALALAVPQLCEDENARGMSAVAVAALGVCAAVAVVLGIALTIPSVRRRLRRAPPTLSPSILRVERRRPESGEWRYDAFVSFAHADEAIAQELVERLEGGTEPLRLCVHYRDWMPGGWIPAQIAASVRVSRRTLALVSEAFLRSKWARAEFREAYAAALEDTEPRLVLVLLEDPTRLRLDSELAAYVSGVTYVRWGDPWFWQKLRSALPAPSVRPAADATAASPDPAPSPPQ